jgi:hypothetical protein
MVRADFCAWVLEFDGAARNGQNAFVCMSLKDPVLEWMRQGASGMRLDV